MQAVLDGLSVLAIALTARSLSPRLTIPAALIAAVLPNFIAHSSYILQETLFTVFFTWGLCALFCSLRSARPARLLIIAGLLFGMTLWTRLTLIYYAIVLVPALAAALKLSGPRTWIQAASHALIPAATMALVISPLLAYNYFTYGHAELSLQTGDHLLRWVYACLATPWPCSDRVAVHAELEPIVRGYSEIAANEYELSIMQKKLAVTSILQLPLWQVAWGMTWGAFRNLFQTSFYFVIGQFNQPETFISAMPGSNLFERIAAFVSANYRNPFMVMWVISQVTLLLSRLVQGAGALTGLRQVQFRGQTILLLATIIYVLALNGPIANPKYRVPCEPALIILTALGWAYCPLFAKWRAWFSPRARY